MTRGALVMLLTLATAACGGSPPPEPKAPATNVPPLASAKPDAPPLLIEYVVIHRKWVEKYVATPAADVKTWSEAAENAELVRGPVRHIVLKVPSPAAKEATKKKAQAILERLKKEDFAKVAKQSSEDTSKDAGGEIPNEALKDLPQELRDAIAALKPGDTSKDPVLVAAGTEMHVFHKDRLEGDRLERAYKKAKAPEAAQKLAEDLQGRFRAKAETRSSIADSVQSVLGEGAANDVDRPRAVIVERDRLKNVRMPAAAKAALETFAQSAHPGDALPSPAVDADTIIVARTARGEGRSAESAESAP